MHTLDQIVTLTNQQNSRNGSLSAFIASIRDNVNAILEKSDLGNSVKTQLEVFFRDLELRKAEIDLSLNRNVPAVVLTPDVAQPKKSTETLENEKAAADQKERDRQTQSHTTYSPPKSR